MQILDYSLLASAFFLLPVLAPMFLKGPIAVFDDLLPGALSAADRTSPFLLHVRRLTRPAC